MFVLKVSYQVTLILNPIDGLLSLLKVAQGGEPNTEARLHFIPACQKGNKSESVYPGTALFIGPNYEEF